MENSAALLRTIRTRSSSAETIWNSTAATACARSSTPRGCRCSARSRTRSWIAFLRGETMPCEPEILKHVPLFARLDDDEVAVLAAQVEVRTFAPRQRIYRIGDPGDRAYVVVSGGARITTIDE